MGSNPQCEKLCFRVYTCKWFCWGLLNTPELPSEVKKKLPTNIAGISSCPYQHLVLSGFLIFTSLSETVSVLICIFQFIKKTDRLDILILNIYM